MSLLNKMLGKIVTVFTLPTNRDFKSEQPQKYPEQIYHYFIGVVEGMDEHGLLLRQPTSGMLSYFFKDHIVALCEEELLDPNDPLHKKAIEKMNAAASQPKASKADPKTPVNPAALQEMLKTLNQQFGQR